MEPGSFGDAGEDSYYARGVSTQNALKLLFELRAVLDRIGEYDVSLRESMAHDVDEAVRLNNACISELTQDSQGAHGGEADDEEDE